jgi:hypothetical protein
MTMRGAAATMQVTSVSKGSCDHAGFAAVMPRPSTTRPGNPYIDSAVQLYHTALELGRLAHATVVSRQTRTLPP